MENILDELWDSYLSDKDPIASTQELTVTEFIEQDEELLRAELNEKQEMLLGVLLSRKDHFTELYGKACFKKGVKFATQYLIEATKNEKR